MEKEQKAHKPHALILPYPAQGHINPMLEFAKRLVHHGVKATVANTKYLNSSMYANPIGQIATETISDGFDEGGRAQAGSIEAYLSTLKVVGARTLANLIRKLNESTHPIDVLIYDGFLPWALDVAKIHGVKGVTFLTQSFAVNSIYYHVHHGLLPLPLSEPTVSLPGLPQLEVSDTPSFVSHLGSYPAFYDTVVNQFRNIDQADWVLYNSFYELEREVVDWVAKLWRVATVGPTVPSMYMDKRIEDGKNYGVDLFKPETVTCMDWLNGKPRGSVVYVSFGSGAELGVEQMEELARGLLGSNCYFLWIVRALEDGKLPSNFREDASEKGLIVTWCPQLQVLAHESIGCFITHCGFNSVIEALSLGVPMVAMPQWTDQPTNAKFVEDVWKTGIRVRAGDDGIVRREVVEHSIKEVMKGEKGAEVRQNANKWKNLAKEAIDVGGTSDQNIIDFVAYLSCP